MQQEELYINNLLMDTRLRGISRTLQANDFSEVQYRQSNYSNQIELPDTPNNVKNLEYLGVIGNTSRAPYTKLVVRYIVDGVELVREGKGVLKQTIDKKYKLVIYDGGIGLSSLLGDELLSDIVVPLEEQRYMSYDDFYSGMKNTSEGLILAIDEKETNFVNTTSFYFYVHTAFERIFANKGFTIESDFTNNNADFKSRVFSMGEGWDQTQKTEVINDFGTVTGTTQHAGSVLPPLTESKIIYTYTSSSTIDNLAFKFYTTVAKGNFGNPTLFGIRAEKNGNYITQKNLDVPLGVTQDGLPADNSVSFVFIVDIEPGDIIELTVLASGKSSSPYNYRYDLNWNLNIVSDRSYWTTNPKTLFPEVTQLNFVKDIIQRFNLMFSIDSRAKKIKLQTSEEVLNDYASAENWSNKFVSDKSETYNSSFARENWFRYSQDDDSNPVGNGVLVVDNENLPETKTVLTSIFKSTNSISAERVEFPIALWDEPEQGETGETKAKKDTPRLFRVKNETAKEVKVALTPQIYIDYKSLVPAKRTTNLTRLSFTEVSYQEEVNKYYVKYKSVLDNYKKKTLEVNLSLVDIYQIDFFKLKYFEQLGKYYYLNKVSNFKPNQTTQIELIEVSVK